MLGLLHTFPVVLQIGSISYVSSCGTHWVYFTCFRSITYWVSFIRFRSWYTLGLLHVFGRYILVLLHTFPVVLRIVSTLYVFGSVSCWVYFIRTQSHNISFLLYIVPLTIYFLSTSCCLLHAACSSSTVLLDLLILIMLVNSANFEAYHYAVFQLMLLLLCYSQTFSSAASSLTRSSLVVRNQDSQPYKTEDNIVVFSFS